jgi:hypothetical protein
MGGSSFTSSTAGPLQVQEAGTTEAVRPRLNFIAGATVVDNPANNSADITVEGSNGNIDGGTPDSVYSPTQHIDGGDPSTMAEEIQFRRGTVSAWATANPILAQGELGLEYDTGQFKVGDGVTTWNDLEYGGLDAQPIVDTGDYGTPTLISTSIPVPTDIRARLYIAGNGAPVVDPTIANGSATQELYLFGTNDTNTVQLDSAANLILVGPILLKNKTQLILNWIPIPLAAWVEASRNEI